MRTENYFSKWIHKNPEIAEQVEQAQLNTLEFSKALEDVYICGFREALGSLSSEYYGLLLRQLACPELTESLCKALDVGILIDMYKGYVLIEAMVVKNRLYSPAPAKSYEFHLRGRIAPAMYNDIAVWTKRQVNYVHHYRSKPSVLAKVTLNQCPACTVYDSREDVRKSANINELYAKIEHDKLRRNVCPICKKYGTKKQITRWGCVKVCMNYPTCNFHEKING